MKVTSVEKKEKSTVELTIQIDARPVRGRRSEGLSKEPRLYLRPRLPQGQGPPQDHRGDVRRWRIL